MGRVCSVYSFVCLNDINSAGMAFIPSVLVLQLWMGTHPKGPATIKGTGQTLSAWLADNDVCALN